MLALASLLFCRSYAPELHPELRAHARAISSRKAWAAHVKEAHAYCECWHRQGTNSYTC